MRKTPLILAAFMLAAIHAGSLSAQDGEDTSMSWFITSTNIGKGADLGGLKGADAHCQSLAEAAGAGDKSWRAYLSSTIMNARDRIGEGPWYNVKGELIARDLADLHDDENDNITAANSYDENGGRIPGLAQGEDATHDMLTGSNSDGRLALELKGTGGIAEHTTGKPATCNDWTGGAGRARVGHFDSQVGEPGTVWNSAHLSLGCSQEEIEKNASVGLFYCFASD